MTILEEYGEFFPKLDKNMDLFSRYGGLHTLIHYKICLIYYIIWKFFFFNQIHQYQCSFNPKNLMVCMIILNKTYFVAQAFMIFRSCESFDVQKNQT